MGGIFGFTGSPEPRLFQVMARALAHRASRGVVEHEDSSATLAYCVGTPESQGDGSTPGLYHEGSQVVAVAGYLTNRETWTSRLPSILERYRREGIAFIESLRGAFVLALRDGDTLYLVRDGLGVRTVYYGQSGGRFYFAIEPKGISSAPGFPRRLRAAALAQYLTFSFVPGRTTMLEDLFELPPGHVLTVNGDSQPRLERYFFFEGDSLENDDMPSSVWVDRFRRQVERAVEERLPKGESVGIFLSGGLDSSLVTAEVARQHNAQVYTYAIHFGDEYPHELSFAESVARRCGTRHENVLVRPRSFLPRLRRIIWHLDDPIGDPITVPNFELASRARQDVGWIFNGEGGDPVFGGPKNIPMLLHHWYGVEREKNFRERRYLASYRRAYEELFHLLTPEWQRRIDPETDLEGVLTPFFDCAVPRSFLNKLMVINIRLKGAHLILPKVDRMLGAWGLVPLAPLFDEELVRLSFQMPARLKLRHGIEKWVMKRAYENDLPREVIERPKSGMRVPVHYWFRGELKRYARKILSPRSLKKTGIFDPGRVQQLLDYDIAEGPGRYGLRLWMLLSFEIWRRIVIEGEAP